MTILFYIFLTIIYIAAFMAGVYFGKNPREAFFRHTAVALFFIFIKMIFIAFPGIEYKWLNVDLYAHISFWWVFPFALYILGLTVYHIQLKWIRIIVESFSGFLLLYFLLLFYFESSEDYRLLKGKVKEPGICMQSFSYSCGAAAAATFLHHSGMYSTEREMAALSGTSRHLGTDEFKISHGLRQRVGKNGRVILEKREWEQLTPQIFPVMAVIEIGFMSDHWVVVTDIKDDTLKVLDPYVGVRYMEKNHFLDVWRKTVVRLE